MKKWIIAVALIGIFVLSVLSGFLVQSFLNFSKEEKDEEDTVLADTNEKEAPEVLDASYSEEKVSPNAKVMVIERFSGCGHTITSVEEAPREIVNLGLEDVKKYYSGWSVDEFTKDCIKISRTNSGICGEHYILRESEGYISISCKNNIGEYIYKGLTDIAVQYLPEQDVEKLKQGIEVVGRESLNKFLEDFE